MAQRSLAGPLTRPIGVADPLRRLWTNRRRDGDPRRTAWWIGTAPYWLGSDVPAPLLPSRDEARPAEIGLAGEHVLTTLDGLVRRLWIQRAVHILARAAWLGLLVGCGWLIVELRGGPPLNIRWLVAVGAVLFLGGIVFAALQRPTRRQVARMLDRSFGLQERLSTAVDHFGEGVPQGRERAEVVYLQMADAANVAADLHGHASLGLRVPVRELVLAIAFGLLMAALYFLRGVGGDVPPVQAGAIPAFTAAADRPVDPEPAAAAAAELAEAPTVDQVRERAQQSGASQRDLAALGRALADHAVTRSAADAIQQGDYEAAADELRELSEQTNQLSPAGREALAADLDQAAAQMAPSSGNLADASQEAAAGLREGDEAAQTGVRELGDAVEQAGSQVAPQGELAQQMREAQAADAQRQQQAGQSGQPGDGSQPSQPSQSEAGQQGQPGQPGEANQPGSQPGEQAGEGSQPGEGEASQPGEGGQPGQSTEGEAGSGQQAGEEAESMSGQQGEAAGDGQTSNAGAGAGTGESDGAPDPGEAANPGGEAAQQPGEEAPADPNVSEGGGEGAEPGEPAEVDETLQLPQSPDGDAGVQTSPDGGGSNRGTGAGVTAGSGTAVQGEVGESGPDSNRVPAPYRLLVERYFSEPDAP